MSWGDTICDQAEKHFDRLYTVAVTLLILKFIGVANIS